MVGVGGRSRACDNCRRRRIKCGEFLYNHRTLCQSDPLDLVSPACSRCIKARLLCGGSQDVCFIQYNGESKQAALSTALSSRSSISGIGASASASDVDMSTSSLRGYSSQSAPLNLFTQLPVAYDEVYLTYTRSHLLREHGELWFDSQPSQSLAEKCLLALSTTYFGIDHLEWPITHLGMSRYGKVLSELNRDLSNPETCQSSDLLFAVIVMTLFEVSVCPHCFAWFTSC